MKRDITSFTPEEVEKLDYLLNKLRTDDPVDNGEGFVHLMDEEINSKPREYHRMMVTLAYSGYTVPMGTDVHGKGIYYQKLNSHGLKLDSFVSVQEQQIKDNEAKKKHEELGRRGTKWGIWSNIGTVVHIAVTVFLAVYTFLVPRPVSERQKEQDTKIELLQKQIDLQAQRLDSMRLNTKPTGTQLVPSP